MDTINSNQPEQNQEPASVPEQPAPTNNIGLDVSNAPVAEPPAGPSLAPDVTPQPSVTAPPVTGNDQPNVPFQAPTEPPMSSAADGKSEKRWIAIGAIIVLLVVVVLVYYLLYK